MKPRNQPAMPASPPPPPLSPSPAENAAASGNGELPPGLAGLTAEADALDAGAAPGAAPAAAEQPAPESPDIPTAKFLEGMLAPLAELLPSVHHGFAAKPLKPGEVQMLAVGWAAVLDHYFPGGVSTWGPWGLALGATVAVVGPRLAVPAPAPRAEAAPVVLTP